MGNQSELKKLAAHQAVEFVESGMIVGLGTGSTTKFAIERIATLLNNGQLKNIAGIPSSNATKDLANLLGIPLTSLNEHPQIDITIDGADEVDQNLNLIKGGGGALLREKVLAQASKRNTIIVDNTKISEYLGEKWPVPVEVFPLARQVETNFLVALGATVKLRRNKDGSIFFTDQENIILDANFGIIHDPDKIASSLNQRAGIAGHGLFIRLATTVIVATKDGIQILPKNKNIELENA